MYANGQLPYSVLVRIPDRYRSPWAEGAIWLDPEAARDFLLLARDFERRFGTVLKITWGYRTVRCARRDTAPAFVIVTGREYASWWAVALRRLTDAEMDTVYGAIVAGSTLI